MPAPQISETQLQEAIRELARTLGLRLYHTHDSRRSYSGFPDLVIVGRGGLLFRELKKDGEHPSPEQRTWLDALTTAGADAGVWRPADLYGDRVRIELDRLRRAQFVCPRCGAASSHPEDRRNGYCGACHDFTGIPAPLEARP